MTGGSDYMLRVDVEEHSSEFTKRFCPPCPVCRAYIRAFRSGTFWQRSKQRRNMASGRGQGRGLPVAASDQASR